MSEWYKLKYDDNGLLIEPKGHDYSTCDNPDCIYCMKLEDDWSEAILERENWPFDE